jgi:DNA-binding response OmpR family regulator
MRDLPTQPAAPPLTALVVCDDDNTLMRLQDYLRRAGVQARATRQLDDAWRQSSGSDALVLLPDDFDAGEVADGLVGLLARTPSPFVILVTAGRQFFEPLIQTFDDAGSLVIMPKPVWGWTIIDLLRSRFEGRA